MYVPFCDVLVYSLYINLSPLLSVAFAFTVIDVVVLVFNVFVVITGATLSVSVVKLPVAVAVS